MRKTIEIALSQYGTTETPGSQHNPEVLKYFEATRYAGVDWISDETAWCSAFANWVAHKAGAHKSGELNARSWLAVGDAVTDPEPGDVVVLWRESKNSWKGHVGFYVNEDDQYIYVLGGNQRNQVNIQAYAKTRLLGYRRITKHN